MINYSTICWRAHWLLTWILVQCRWDRDGGYPLCCTVCISHPCTALQLRQWRGELSYGEVFARVSAAAFLASLSAEDDRSRVDHHVLQFQRLHQVRVPDHATVSQLQKHSYHHHHHQTLIVHLVDAFLIYIYFPTVKITLQTSPRELQYHIWALM